ncbi:hypothetical protein HUW48_12655 [Adhaeribacter radiodurans]|uniref:Antitoxin n=1 Tax=Adhaeribacter radiodurans TaxID=2745197 RepID=A0A7L7L8H2_9BACT|nr:hypothetical protein HUW48_12655 [Adhaeribacter radiodurans]
MRHCIKSYFNELIQSREFIIVPRNNTNDDAVVIISLKEYIGLQETNYLLASPANCLKLEDPSPIKCR